MALINSFLNSAIAALNGHRDEEDGQAMVEYGLLVALISIAAIVPILLIGPKLLAAFTSVANSLP